MKLTAEQTAIWLKERLDSMGLTQEEFAEKTGISAGDVSRYKNHKQRPRIDQVERLAAALEVDVVEMLIGLGAIDPKAKTTPKVTRGGRNSSVKW